MKTKDNKEEQTVAETSATDRHVETTGSGAAELCDEIIDSLFPQHRLFPEEVIRDELTHFVFGSFAKLFDPFFNHLIKELDIVGPGFARLDSKWMQELEDALFDVALKITQKHYHKAYRSEFCKLAKLRWNPPATWGPEEYRSVFSINERTPERFRGRDVEKPQPSGHAKN